jgi:hypothetical protein
MSQQKPSIGRIVHYRLSEGDAAVIAEKRAQNARLNPHSAGDTVALVIARVWPDEYGSGTPGVNGQALLDGESSLWVTSAREGTEPGQWSWPPRV